MSCHCLPVLLLLVQYWVEQPYDMVLHIVSFASAFLASRAVVFNPYLRGRMVQLLRYTMPQRGDRWRNVPWPELVTSSVPTPPGTMACIANNAVAMAHLGPALLRFFVDIGFTGSHTQFYDKFQYRSCAVDVLEYVWTLRTHREAVVTMASKLVRHTCCVR